MIYEDALKLIYKRQMFGMKLGLDNIKSLLESLGNPEKSFRCVHVAGTNGKGSTCAFISSIMQEAGYKVGLYTSPHLTDFRERIQINRELIPKRRVAMLLEKMLLFLDKHTYFEVVTALAFMHFSMEKIDLGVIEVGLGGRLDATNVISPEVSVITSISLDHIEHLGKTLDAIAAEKAGIIKPNSDVVVNSGNKALKVIEEQCRKKSSRLHLAETAAANTSLNGDFQKENAGLALCTIDVLRKKGFRASNHDIIRGLQNARWPGRMQYIGNRLLLDCAHNPEGMMALRKELEKLNRPVYMVIGIMEDKDISGMCRELDGIAEEYILTRPKIERSAEPARIAEHICGKTTIVENVKDAVEYAKLRAGKNGLVVIAGSIFLVGEAFPEPSHTQIDKRRISKGKSHL